MVSMWRNAVSSVSKNNKNSLCALVDRVFYVHYMHAPFPPNLAILQLGKCVKGLWFKYIGSYTWLFHVRTGTSRYPSEAVVRGWFYGYNSSRN